MILAIFVLIVDNSTREIILKKMPCIYYPIWFQKDQEKVKALIDNGSAVNAICPAHVKKLGLKTQKTSVGAQQIDGTIFESFEIVIATF